MSELRIKINIRNVLRLVLFAAGCANKYLLVVWLFYLTAGGIQSTARAIDGLLLIAFRTILNEKIAVDISSVQMIKWAAIFALATLILLHRPKPTPAVKTAIALLCALSAYIFVASIFRSSYPITSMFKCFSYAYVFGCVLIGVTDSSESEDYSERLYRYFALLMLACLLSLPFPFAYYSSARWFAGVTNQSQMLGITAALYVAMLCKRILDDRLTLGRAAMLALTFVMIFMSNCRTGMFAAVACLVIFVCKTVVQRRFSYVAFGSIAAVLAGLVGLGDSFVSSVRGFLAKGGTSTAITLGLLTESRRGQLAGFLTKLEQSPLFGSGFAVPYVAGEKSRSLDFGLVVEPGNILYAVLGDIGIVGLILFSALYLYIFAHGKRDGSVLEFIAPFLICIGEMVFFSTNNIAVFLYVMLASYLSDGCRGRSAKSEV